MILRSICLSALLAAMWLPLSAAPISFSAHLSGPSEEPPNGSPGTGFTIVTIDRILHTLRVEVTFAGLTAGNTASHIHLLDIPGDATLGDTLGPVATTTPTFPGFPSGTTSGSYDMTLDTLDLGSYRAGFVTAQGGTAALAEAVLFDKIEAGQAYLNIHTSNFPGGEIRGFLAPIPEPATVGLVGIVIGTAALLRRRIKVN